MPLRKLLKKAGNYFSFYPITVVLFLASPFSIHFVEKLAGVIGFIAFYIAYPRSRIAMKNLDTAYGDRLSCREKRAIAISSAQNLVKTAFELHYFYVRGMGEVKRKISFEGLDNYKQALKKGPVLFISGHVGNFPIMGSAFSSEGFTINVIAKAISSKGIEKLLNVYRKKLKQPVIYYHPRFMALKKAIKSLRTGCAVFIYVDQRFSHGIKTTFFGKNVLTATGANALAKKTGASVLPAFISRNGTRHIIHIGKAIAVNGSEEENTQLFTSAVEEAVRKSPGQWFWFHRRWR
ncbi:MAG: lysophospholipid acyltransferase family protein [Elusimicrobiota bacterium]|nr:lysophospholipid acyltransferase family protein [Elusimicrobiota bacterium]